jgi:hypothetical protein
MVRTKGRSVGLTRHKSEEMRLRYRSLLRDIRVGRSLQGFGKGADLDRSKAPEYKACASAQACVPYGFRRTGWGFRSPLFSTTMKPAKTGQKTDDKRK